MHILTKEQKVENFQELISQKERKIKNLQKEVEDLRRKMSGIREIKRTNPARTVGPIFTSGPMDLIPGAVRNDYIYNSEAPSYASLIGLK